MNEVFFPGSSALNFRFLFEEMDGIHIGAFIALAGL